MTAEDPCVVVEQFAGACEHNNSDDVCMDCALTAIRAAEAAARAAGYRAGQAAMRERAAVCCGYSTRNVIRALPIEEEEVADGEG